MTIKEQIKILIEQEKAGELGKAKEPTKFEKLLDQYEERFNTMPPTEPSTYSKEKWCDVLEECLEKNITVQELFGMEYGDDWND